MIIFCIFFWAIPIFYFPRDIKFDLSSVPAQCDLHPRGGVACSQDRSSRWWKRQISITTLSPRTTFMMDWPTLIRIHPSPVTSHAYPSSSLMFSWLKADKHGKMQISVQDFPTFDNRGGMQYRVPKRHSAEKLSALFIWLLLMVITKEPNWRLRRSAATLRCTFHPNQCSEHARFSSNKCPSIMVWAFHIHTTHQTRSE